MSSVRKILKFIDTVSETSGWVAKWFALILVFAGTYEAVSRHFFNAPTEWAYDVLCMAGGTLYLLGASYDYLHESHTRVDMFYNMLPPRGKAFMNVICSLFSSSRSWASCSTLPSRGPFVPSPSRKCSSTASGILRHGPTVPSSPWGSSSSFSRGLRTSYGIFISW